MWRSRDSRPSVSLPKHSKVGEIQSSQKSSFHKKSAKKSTLNSTFWRSVPIPKHSKTGGIQREPAKYQTQLCFSGSGLVGPWSCCFMTSPPSNAGLECLLLLGGKETKAVVVNWITAEISSQPACHKRANTCSNWLQKSYFGLFPMLTFSNKGFGWWLKFWPIQ